MSNETKMSAPVDVLDRNCATADEASISSYADGGTSFVTYSWADGAERTISYPSTGSAMESLRGMGFGIEYAADVARVGGGK